MLLIKNGHVKTMAGADLENGCVLIDEDGKIAAVEASIEESADMTVIDAGGRLVTPGCVEAHCHIGLYNSAMRWEGADGNEKSDPVTPQMRAIDAIDPLAPAPAVQTWLAAVLPRSSLSASALTI